MEAIPFDRGAQRQIYRLKKISQAPTVNWRKIDWAHAPNYVAKSYLTPDGSIGTDDKVRCFNDVRLQYEAAHWATIFNQAGPPKGIHVIQCYVLELTSRPGSPVVGCERFVDGHDKYGAGFVKHNSNSGFVDGEENRATPQAFSAHSFYASAGKLMVVDVQGVGDLYTDPQVSIFLSVSLISHQIHTQDDRFGNSDLGIRGMALFFVSFRRNPVCDFLKLPRFPLSSKERARMLASTTKEVKKPIGSPLPPASFLF
jgi:elongation factor 2 kinase